MTKKGQFSPISIINKFVIRVLKIKSNIKNFKCIFFVIFPTYFLFYSVNMSIIHPSNFMHTMYIIKMSPAQQTEFNLPDESWRKARDVKWITLECQAPVYWICFCLPHRYFVYFCVRWPFLLIECPYSTYKDFTGYAESCIACPANSRHSRIGSSSRADCRCLEGYEGNPAGYVECKSK